MFALDRVVETLFLVTEQPLVPEDETVDLPLIESVVEVTEGVELIGNDGTTVGVEQTCHQGVSTPGIADKKAEPLNLTHRPAGARPFDERSTVAGRPLPSVTRNWIDAVVVAPTNLALPALSSP